MKWDVWLDTVSYWVWKALSYSLSFISRGKNNREGDWIALSHTASQCNPWLWVWFCVASHCVPMLLFWKIKDTAIVFILASPKLWASIIRGTAGRRKWAEFYPQGPICFHGTGVLILSLTTWVWKSGWRFMRFVDCSQGRTVWMFGLTLCKVSAVPAEAMLT